MAECSLSTGRMVAPCLRAVAISKGPPSPAFLVGQRQRRCHAPARAGPAPARPRRRWRSSPSRRGGRRPRRSPAAPAAASVPVPARASRRAGRSAGSAQTAISARKSARDLGQPRDVAPAGQRATVRKACAPPARQIRSTVCSPTEPVTPKIDRLRIGSAPWEQRQHGQHAAPPGSRKGQRVEAVHQPAVTRDQVRGCP
jgi:hypothetical protein